MADIRFFAPASRARRSPVKEPVSFHCRPPILREDATGRCARQAILVWVAGGPRPSSIRGRADL